MILNTSLGKLFLTIISMLTIIVMYADYQDAKDERELQYLKREQELLQVAIRLNDELSSFQQILFDKNALNQDEDTQTQILSQTLQPIVKKIAVENPGIALGYYSRNLNRNVAVGPQYDSSFLREVTVPGALEIYETGQYRIMKIEKSMLWEGKPIMAVHLPINRQGRIIGHTFANAKIEDIEAAYASGLWIRIARMGIIWLIFVTLIFVAFYRMRKVVQELVRKLESEDDDTRILDGFPEFLPILDNVVLLRDKIKQDNQVLTAANNKLSTIIDTCPVSILEVDKRGNIISLNEPMLVFFQKFIPYQRQSLIGKPIKLLYDEMGVTFEETIVAEALKGKEFRNKLVERLDYIFLVNAIPIYGPGTQDIASCFIFFQDITEYEFFKNKMARLESLNAIGETASAVAHELRNPATSIKGFVQLMSLKCTEQQRQYFAIILEELERMNEIIEDFLSLARNRLMEKAPYDLNQIIKSLSPLLTADTIKNDIEMHYELCDKIRIIELNPKEVRQVILNIVRNAIDAMPRKGQLTVRTENVLNGIEMSISDTGSGIPPEQLPEIFKPFYTSKKDGTGLGLAVCKNIVEAHGGSIKVSSEVGKGTTFMVYFPI